MFFCAWQAVAVFRLACFIKNSCGFNYIASAVLHILAIASVISFHNCLSGKRAAGGYNCFSRLSYFHCENWSWEHVACLLPFSTYSVVNRFTTSPLCLKLLKQERNCHEVGVGPHCTSGQALAIVESWCAATLSFYCTLSLRVSSLSFLSPLSFPGNDYLFRGSEIRQTIF